MILVTGATGDIGTELAKRLWARGEIVRALVRDRTRARALSLPGVEIAEGDYSKPYTLTRSLAGVDRVFLVVPLSAEFEKLHRSFVDLAKRSGAGLIVALSQFGADSNAAARFPRCHGIAENYARKSGILHTFLRSNFLMQNFFRFRATISAKDIFYAPAADAAISVVDARDVAGVAMRSLLEKGHQGRTYEITGPAALTHAEMAKQLSTAVGRTIRYGDVAPEAMRDALTSTAVSTWHADGTLEEYERYRNGEAARVTSTIRAVTGSDATPFSQFAADYAGRFAARAAGIG